MTRLKNFNVGDIVVHRSFSKNPGFFEIGNIKYSTLDFNDDEEDIEFFTKEGYKIGDDVPTIAHLNQLFYGNGKPLNHRHECSEYLTDLVLVKDCKDKILKRVKAKIEKAKNELIVLSNFLNSPVFHKD